MLDRTLKSILLVLILTIFTVSCSKGKNILSPDTNIDLSLDQLIKEIIFSKDTDYNFLEDNQFMDLVNELGVKLTKGKSPHFTIGNLDKDNIPEIVIFQERDQNDVNDEGSLEIYKFSGDKYNLIDKISMNYDNTNYQMIIGKISKDQNGLLLNNQVGSHSGLTYGFILKDDKLKSIFNHNKIPLLSIYTENEIKDINNDGILEFSVYMVDPETEDSSLSNSDKMKLWYRWDGKDSVTLLEVERNYYSPTKSDKAIYDQASTLIENNLLEAFQYMEENKNNLSKYDNTELLIKYIKALDENLFDKSVEINNLFSQYTNEENYKHLYEKYGLTSDKFNNIEYLSREKVLKDELNIKNHLIENIKIGYKINFSEEKHYYSIDFQRFIEIFNQNITNEYNDYLNLLALDISEPIMINGKLTLSMDDLTERILLVEGFKTIYPYSNFMSKINELYKLYIYTYFYGDEVNPNFNSNNFTVKPEIIKKFKTALEKYEFTYFGDIISSFLGDLKENDNIINTEIRKNLTDMLT